MDTLGWPSNLTYASEDSPARALGSRRSTPRPTRRPTGAPASGDETDLVERLRTGSPEAIAEAYDRHAGAVFAFARRLLGDATEASDLVHETFVSLPRAIRAFRSDASLRTFLVAIAVNHARHHVRAAKRRRAAMDRLSREPTEHESSPERAMHGRDLARALTEALDRLPLEQRVAFVLCEVEERSAQEVAALTKAPEVTVRTRVFKAKAKLREELARRGFR